MLLNQADLDKSTFSFANSQELEIKKKIEKFGTPLKNWDIKINSGIKTGFNEAFIISTEKRNEILNNCTSSDERERTEKIIKKIIKGRHIKRYSYEWADLWIISTFPTLKLNIEDYPAIKDYLLTFGNRLNQTGEIGSRKKTGNKWFETQDQIAYWQEFEKEKIVFSKASKENVFALDNQKIFFDVTAYMLSSINTKYLIAFLNSKMFKYSFYNFYSGGGIDGEVTIFALETFPIPKPTEQSEKALIGLVDEILELKPMIHDFEELLSEAIKNDEFSREVKLKKEIEKLKTRVIELETEIDNLVYKLYDLNSDEIMIIEGR